MNIEIDNHESWIARWTVPASGAACSMADTNCGDAVPGLLRM